MIVSLYFKYKNNKKQEQNSVLIKKTNNDNLPESGTNQLKYTEAINSTWTNEYIPSIVSINKDKDNDNITYIDECNDNLTNSCIYKNENNYYNTGLSPFDEQMIDLYNETNNIKNKLETEKFEMVEYMIEKNIAYKPISTNQKVRLLHKIKKD